MLKSVDGKRWTFWRRFNIAGKNGVYLRRLRIIQTPYFGVYLHRIDEPDPDLDPHDHPWVFWSVILRGGYVERVWRDKRVQSTRRLVGRRRFSIHKMRLQSAHRIVEVRPGTVTLIITGPRVNEWGFWVPREGLSPRFIVWQDYVEMRGNTAVRKKEPAE